MEKILSRIDPTFGQTIYCGEGWHDLILELDEELSQIDPDYRIYQVKEKFGALRVYLAPSNPMLQSELSKIVEKYERISLLTCEMTGKPGEPMKLNGRVRTLHRSFMEKGWKPIEWRE